MKWQFARFITHRPTLKPRFLVGFSEAISQWSIWSEQWKRMQQFSSLLEHKTWVNKILYFNPDVYLSNIVESPLSWMQPPLIYSLRHIFPKQVTEDITAFTPVHLPLAGRFKQLERIREKRILNICDPFVSIPYIIIINRPLEVEDSIYKQLFKNAAYRVFDWQDDFIEFDKNQDMREKTKTRCDDLVKNSDLVLTINDRLNSRAKLNNQNSYTLKNGTAISICSNPERPPPLASLKGPIIGYSGLRVSFRMDTELINELAEKRPDWNFVFIGPASGEDPLKYCAKNHQNIHLLDAVDYALLPSYIANFDVCILPNLINAHTLGNDPIKLYDYLATGKPIVSTPTAGVEALRELLQIAQGQDDFAHAIEDALHNDSDEKRDLRLKTSQLHSWTARTNELEKLIRMGFSL